jgi:hypothetical protein
MTKKGKVYAKRPRMRREKGHGKASRHRHFPVVARSVSESNPARHAQRLHQKAGRWIASLPLAMTKKRKFMEKGRACGDMAAR